MTDKITKIHRERSFQTGKRYIFCLRFAKALNFHVNPYLKLFQEPHVVFVKEADVVDAMARHNFLAMGKTLSK